MKLRCYPRDPVLQATNFRCGYCGRDLLADLDTFVCLVRDHFIPHSAGGPNGAENRVASCAVCDRLKRDAVVADLAEARELIAWQRRCYAKWLGFVRAKVRRGGGIPVDSHGQVAIMVAESPKPQGANHAEESSQAQT